MKLEQLLRKTKKIRITFLLIILVVCLGILFDKRRTESALVSNGSDLAAAIWAVVPFLPPGDLDPATVSRNLSVDLPDSGPLTLQLQFEDEQHPWPSRLVLTYYPNQPEHIEYRSLVLIPPGEERATESKIITASGEEKKMDPVSLNKMIADLTTLKTILEKDWPLLSEFQWQARESGLETATAYMRYGPRLGGRELHLIRFDPANFTFKPWHELDLGLKDKNEEIDLDGWAKQLPSAVALINGGQYEIDRSYIGWLKRDGKFISGTAKPSWSGYFVSSPSERNKPGTPRATIIDLEEKGRQLKPADYENIMQSLMLRDAEGKIRVNNSFHLASRAAIGEDEEGRILFIMNPGAVSLHDLAVVLGDRGLKLKRVLCLDGGFEAQLLWRDEEGEFISNKAQYLVFPNETIYAQELFRSLPSVIAAVPVKEE